MDCQNNLRRNRRLRYNSVVRDLVRENLVTLDDLICPIFVKYGQNSKSEIKTMPGQYQITVDLLKEEINEIKNLGLKSILLFGVPEKKDQEGSDSFSDNGIVQQAIRKIKSFAPDLFVISDVCLCQYTTLGHCGYINHDDKNYIVDNDKTLEILKKQAVSHAKAGSDMIAPSGMIDYMVKSIRLALDENGYYHIPIMSYSVKYKSAMYGPFAGATDGAAKKGDRSSMQMDVANSDEAIKEVLTDIDEGADILMVKPAHTYLDIIYRIKSQFPYMPLAAYHPSGEYAMLKSAFSNGYLNEESTVSEVLTAIKRSGADIIITYFAKEFAKWLKNKQNT